MRARVGLPVGLIAAGILVIQLAWTFVVPAFGGIDEVDHSYRAASIGHGHWATSGRKTSLGRGTLIKVPADIVEAAHDRCAALPYTGWFNCRPVGQVDRHGDVLIASGASRYNPAYYAVVGNIAEPFDGAAALYAMRLVSSALCTLLFAGAMWIALACSRSLWPTAGVLLSITPVVLYASTVVAPNGLHLAAAILMWCALIALMESPRGKERVLLVLLSIAVPIVLLTHTSGPMWVGLTFLVALVAWRGRLVDLWHKHRFRLIGLAVWVALVTVAGVLWTVTQKANLAGDGGGGFTGLTMGDLINAMALWILQSIGALPFRNEYVPIPVFAISLIPFIAVTIVAARLASARLRTAMGVIMVASLAVPVALTVLTFPTLGLAWQGRYTLPLAFGLPLIAVWAIDGAHRVTRRSRALIPIAITAFVVTQVVSFIAIAERQRPGWPTEHTSGPPPIEALLAAGLTSAVFIAVGIMLWFRTRTRGHDFASRIATVAL